MSNNVGLFEPADAWRALLWNLAFALGALAVLRPVYGDWHRPAALASVLIALCFTYGALTNKWLRLGSGYPTLALIGVVWMLLAFACLKLRRVGSGITQVLNAVVVVMLVGPLLGIARAQSLDGPLETEPDAAVTAALAVAPGPPEGTLPTIHHIVLDGYSRADVLRDLYGFDNAPFLDDLRALGFAVADGATTPYGQTLLAMASIFSMNYLDAHVAAVEAAHPGLSEGGFRRRLASHFRSSPVRRATADRGYGFVAVDTEYGPLRVSDADQLLVSPDLSGLTYFERELYGMTPLLPITNRLAARDDRHTPEATRAVFALGDHGGGDAEPPVLVYNHVVSPHPPFSLDRDGRPRNLDRGSLGDGNHWLGGDPERERLYREGYLEKLRFTNRALLAQLRGLIATAEGPLVIVVHGDHGGGLYLDHGDVDRTCAKERFATLLAVYASSGRAQRALGHDVNLVNLYRIVFAAEFGADLPRLPNRSYFVPWDDPRGFGLVDPERLRAYDARCGAAADG